MSEIVKKEEVEKLLECGITNELFSKALEYAKRKQMYIYNKDHQLAVLKRWYLVKLTEEYARGLALSKFTTDLCRTLRNMEKEHSTKSQSTPTDSHIVSVPAL